MSVFTKWSWIKRNWTYIIEEASYLDLLFVGGTALNLVLFHEYRASEDIDLYDPNAHQIGTGHEQEMADQLAERLSKKGFPIHETKKHTLYAGPHIKIDVFNNSTSYNSIEPKRIDQTNVLLFDEQTYADMKMNSLLCRSLYDARDLVDLFVIKKGSSAQISFPKMDCEVIETSFEQRIQDIRSTDREDLYLFQYREQVEDLPFDEFLEFKRWMYDWLSGFC